MVLRGWSGLDHRRGVVDDLDLNGIIGDHWALVWLQQCQQTTITTTKETMS
jgi:hypothetical protein